MTEMDDARGGSTVLELQKPLGSLLLLEPGMLTMKYPIRCHRYPGPPALPVAVPHFSTGRPPCLVGWLKTCPMTWTEVAPETRGSGSPEGSEAPHLEHWRNH